MAAKQISDISQEADGTMRRKAEYLIDSEADIDSIPDVAPGSVAYTPDLSFMAMYDGDEWHQIGGGDDEGSSSPSFPGGGDLNAN